MLQFLFFLIGVVILCLGADWLVRGASQLADLFGLPKAVVGLGMVALGTSAPELFVNLLAAYRGNVDFALANVSGSNMANLCIGFGLCTLLGTLPIRREDFGRDSILLLATPLLVWLLFQLTPGNALPLWASVPLTIMILGYFVSLMKRSGGDDVSPAPNTAAFMSIGVFLIGILGLYAGGEIVLSSAIKFAAALGVGKDVIALTVVALGTSVPDITASVIAVSRKEYEIAVGNILGSNISNIGLVLNGTLMVHCCKLPTTSSVRSDYLFVCVLSAVLCGIVFFSGRLTRKLGMAMLAAYVGYIVFRLATMPAVAA